MAFQLSERSLKNLQGVHPNLSAIITRAAEISTFPFIVTEGLRTLERQKQLVAAGASKTMKSRHLTGHAVDLAPVIEGEVRWDWPLFHVLAKDVKKAAFELNTEIEWGGGWRTFKDGPHFQLPWEFYP